MWNILKAFKQDKYPIIGMNIVEGNRNYIRFALDIQMTEEQWNKLIKMHLQTKMKVELVLMILDKEKLLGKVFADVDTENSYGY